MPRSALPKPHSSGQTAGPSQADIAAASDMSQAECDELIRSMVERLASPLETSSDDLDGRLRLANAYQVLGKMQKAQNAYGRAEQLAQGLPKDDSKRQAIVSALEELAG